MSEKTLKETDNPRDQKRKQLDRELSELQQKLEQSVDELRGDVQSKLKPVYWIKRYPIQAASLAVFAGFLLAGKRRRKRKVRSENKNSSQRLPELPPAPSEPGIPAIIGNELKRAFTQRATSYLLRYIDDFIDKKFGDDKSGKEEDA